MRWPWQKENYIIPLAQEPIYAINDPEHTLDVNSGTWLFVKDWAAKELEIARRKNDAIKLPYDKTAALRGEIKVLKNLVNLPELIKSRDNRLTKSTPPDDSAGGEDDGDDD
jgi:hypothetical protein